MRYVRDSGLKMYRRNETERTDRPAGENHPVWRAERQDIAGQRTTFRRTKMWCGSQYSGARFQSAERAVRYVDTVAIDLE